MDLSKKISELTLREFYAVFGPTRERQYQYGIIGIAKIFGCSRNTAQKIKNSGVIDDAIYQNGHIIVVDVTMALLLFKENGKNNQNH